MSKQTLTKTLIESVEPPTKGRTYLNDSKVPGLQLYVTSAGTMTFCVYRKVNGRPRRINVGRYPDLSISQARKKAQRILGDLAMGEDIDKPDVGTFGSLWELYLEVHAKPFKRSWKQDEYTYDRHLKKWANRQLTEITTHDCQKLHVGIASKIGSTTANRVRALLSTMFSLAVKQGIIDANPVSRVSKFKEKSRDRFLTEDEMARFFRAVDADQNETFRDYISLSIYTGARQGNVMGMRWKDVDLDNATWRVPETKAGETQFIHLPGQAIEILRRRHEHREANIYVLPGRGGGGHMTCPGKAWKRV